MGGALLLALGVLLVYLAATDKLVPVLHILQDAWTNEPAGTHARGG